MLKILRRIKVMMMTFLMMLEIERHNRKVNQKRLMSFFDDSQKEGDELVNDFPEFNSMRLMVRRIVIWTRMLRTFFMDESVDEKERVEKESKSRYGCEW